MDAVSYIASQEVHDANDVVREIVHHLAAETPSLNPLVEKLTLSANSVWENIKNEIRTEWRNLEIPTTSVAQHEAVCHAFRHEKYNRAKEQVENDNNNFR